MKRQLVFAILTCLCLLSSAQNDTALTSYSIGLILPFQSGETAADIERFSTAADAFTASRIHLDEDAVTALDFYQGLTQAINTTQSDLKINLHVYDCYNSDSVTQILLNKPEMKKLDMIIGPVTLGNGKLVASFCKNNKILNVQPFSPSKSLTGLNPYHLKLAPTIDAHVDNMFQSIVDSFPGANVIIYSPNNETGFNAAKRFDSLFKNYNKVAEKRFTHVLLNAKDMMVNGKKTTASEQLKLGVKNIWIITSFEESFVNGNFRVMHGNREKYDIVAYGMPTWMKGDVMRLDYVNDFNSRVSDPFWVDTTTGLDTFAIAYKASYSIEPSPNAYLGYDVMNFVYRVLKVYGKNFLPNIVDQRYTGVGYKFDVMLEMKGDAVNYYENRHVNVIAVKDYKLQRVW